MSKLIKIKRLSKINKDLVEIEKALEKITICKLKLLEILYELNGYTIDNINDPNLILLSRSYNQLEDERDKKIRIKRFILDDLYREKRRWI